MREIWRWHFGGAAALLLFVVVAGGGWVVNQAGRVVVGLLRRLWASLRGL